MVNIFLYGMLCLLEFKVYIYLVVGGDKMDELENLTEEEKRQAWRETYEYAREYVFNHAELYTEEFLEEIREADKIYRLQEGIAPDAKSDIMQVVAKRLIEQDTEIEYIMAFTNLSRTEIQALKRELKKE